MGFSSSTYYVYSPNYIHYSVCKQPPRPYSSIASKKNFFVKKNPPHPKVQNKQTKQAKVRDSYTWYRFFAESPKLRNCCKNVHIFSPLECCELTNVKKEDVNTTAAESLQFEGI